MTHALLICALALMALTGCSSVQLNSAPLPVRMDAVATLATNECEALTAGDYTAVIVARRSATARLKAGTLTVDTARQVQASADEARAALDAACQGKQLDAAQLARAHTAQARLKQLLETRP